MSSTILQHEKNDEFDLDYSNILFHCQVWRKHLLKDVIYHLYVIEGNLVLSSDEQTQNPKYLVPMQYDQIIHWQIENKTNKLKSFGFYYQKKIKYFESPSSNLEAIKILLSNKFVYRDVSDFYTPIQILGRGISSQVHLVLQKQDSLRYASKCINKLFLTKEGGFEALYNEIDCMNKLTHPNIIQLQEIYEGDKSFYLILQYMKGESLAQLIKSNFSQAQYFTFPKIQEIIKNILQGVAYMHSQKVMHRDLKPENIMISSHGILSSLKIVDFGLATSTECDKFLFSKCGTPGYTAPEVLNYNDYQDNYDLVCDMFSVGVIMYKLITFKDLFPGNSNHEILKLNRKCSINLTILALYKTPKSAIDLLQNMLKVNPEKRIQADDALKHPFFFDTFEQQDQNSLSSRRTNFQNQKAKDCAKPLWKTHGFENEPVQRFFENDEEFIIDEDIPIVQVPTKHVKKNFLLGSYMLKQEVLGLSKPVNPKQKMFRQFQTSEFDNFNGSNVKTYRPTLVESKQIERIQDHKITQDSEPLEQ